ncbi:MAG TPA: hypothetical protein IAB55_06615 [Candidatus Merdivicinus faecavium]|nr:hypothetical protein [Candidatus Merdivicinus faecavium]
MGRTKEFKVESRVLLYGERGFGAPSAALSELTPEEMACFRARMRQKDALYAYNALKDAGFDVIPSDPTILDEIELVGRFKKREKQEKQRTDPA